MLYEVITDRPLAVDGLPERIDDAAEEALADRHLENAAGRLDRGAFRDVLVVTEDDSTPRVLLGVPRQAAGVEGTPLKAPMPGMIVKYLKQVGDTVKKRNNFV